MRKLREFIEEVKSGVESGEKKLKVKGTWSSREEENSNPEKDVYKRVNFYT